MICVNGVQSTNQAARIKCSNQKTFANESRGDIDVAKQNTFCFGIIVDLIVHFGSEMVDAFLRSVVLLRNLP